MVQLQKTWSPDNIIKVILKGFLNSGKLTDMGSHLRADDETTIIEREYKDRR